MSLLALSLASLLPAALVKKITKLVYTIFTLNRDICPLQHLRRIRSTPIFRNRSFRISLRERLVQMAMARLDKRTPHPNLPPCLPNKILLFLFHMVVSRPCATIHTHPSRQTNRPKSSRYMASPPNLAPPSHSTHPLHLRPPPRFINS